MTNQNHPYHLVSVSPWPIIISFSLFNNLIAMVSWFHKMNYFTILTIPPTLLCMYQWWRDVTRWGYYTSPSYNMCLQWNSYSNNLIYYLSNFILFLIFLSMFSLFTIP